MKKKPSWIKKETLINIFLGLCLLLIFANLLILNFNLKLLREEQLRNRVMGVTTSAVCPDACLSSIPKKIYIPLGTGTTASQNAWASTGAKTYVNLADYPSLKSLNWEASLSVPSNNGAVHARLINASNQVEIWNSELFAEGSTPKFVSSGPLTFSSGSRLYEVQLKSTMGVEVKLEASRLVLTLR